MTWRALRDQFTYESDVSWQSVVVDASVQRDKRMTAVGGLGVWR